MDRARLLAEMRAGRARWDATLDHVPRDRMLEPRLDAGWSVKDVLAHVAAWERVATARLQAGLARETPMVPLEGAPVDERNQRYFDANRETGLDDVVAGELEAWAQLASTVEALEDADLDEPARLGLRSDGSPWRMIAANAHEHFDEHIAQIEGWLAAESYGMATGGAAE